MLSRISGMTAVLAAAALLIGAVPAAAQIREVDPDAAIDADLVPGAPASRAAEQDTRVSRAPADSSYPDGGDIDGDLADGSLADGSADGAPVDDGGLPPADGQRAPVATASTVPQANGPTYKKDDLIGAAEGVFGKGAKGLAELIEKVLKDQGEPNAYIAGREASGAFVVGLRYGSGTLFHKVEGERAAYWTGPSLGFDVGGNASKTFVLVYNLYDSQELYKRFPAGEGNAYFVGGFTASYLRSGDTVLIPIRLGVGYRLGISAGYMKFSEKQKWMPF
ncbi:DUF1134 domain-containing protein [Sphingomonas sanxanigenens]|uniref:DUF1134 domain-containing protein n=1 Tax=Sphingomonas sanxanigenens DSM 19645 = NX02 TaxID=1123269 RepID=W0AD93_9SPHN|nr:DUF1134 domain-containing protein [Sphingomonas sanxanigenens]AHE55879.1 hypothetical protein NX02_21200 [Sphingomonas sanxanigenens DSM 19645 = NX02]